MDRDEQQILFDVGMIVSRSTCEKSILSPKAPSLDLKRLSVCQV